MAESDVTGRLYGQPWSDKEYKLVLDAYFQFKDKPRYPETPFVQELSVLLDRTPAAIVMRLGNYASIDPERNEERHGLGHVSDKCISEFKQWVGQKDHLRSLANYLRSELAQPLPLFGEDGDQSPGTAFKYDLLDKIGVGGFAEVFSCVERESGRLFAIKIIQEESRFGPDVVDRFLREIQVLQTVTHPTIIRIHDTHSGMALRKPAYVMDLAVKSLFGYLEEIKRAGVPRPLLRRCEATAIFEAMLHAVKTLHCHDPQIIHRDINPSNVLLMPDGRWVLADFGLAKFLSKGEQRIELTRTRVGLGTAFYAAPEQWEDLKRTDTAADIFALGVLMWELFTTGGLPPEADQLCESLAPIFRTATRRDPADRYRSVAELSQHFHLAMGLPEEQPPAHG